MPWTEPAANAFTRIFAVAPLPTGPAWPRRLDHLRTGDALVIWKLDRIGRSLKHVVELVDGLQKRGIGLKVLTGGIDTTSSTGRLVFGIFATLAEFERDLIKERTMAGLMAARARGRRRPAAANDAHQAAHGRDDDGRTEQCRNRRRRAARISLSTLYAYVDGKGQSKPRARKLLAAGR